MHSNVYAVGVFNKTIFLVFVACVFEKCVNRFDIIFFRFVLCGLRLSIGAKIFMSKIFHLFFRTQLIPKVTPSLAILKTDEMHLLPLPVSSLWILFIVLFFMNRTHFHYFRHWWLCAPILFCRWLPSYPQNIGLKPCFSVTCFRYKSKSCICSIHDDLEPYKLWRATVHPFKGTSFWAIGVHNSYHFFHLLSIQFWSFWFPYKYWKLH